MERVGQFWSSSYGSLKTTGSAVAEASKKALANNHEKLVPLAIAAVAVGGAVLIISKCKTQGPRSISNSAAVNNLIEYRPGILRLPAETRVQIWKLLSYKDILKLRLVTDAFKGDVDLLVGLRMTLNKSKKPEQYEFAKRVALQEARILSVEDALDPSGFFYDSYLMKKLEIFEKYGPISVWNISRLMKHCVNLTHLKLRLFHTMSSELNEISRVLVSSILGKLVNLVHLEFVRHLSRPLPQLRAKITPTKNYACPKKLEVIIVEAPELTDTAVYNWKYLLEQQTNLRTLAFNVGAIHWNFFEQVIPKNPLLTHVKLMGLKNCHLQGEDTKPFDWGIFQPCAGLTDIYVCSTVTSGPLGTDLLISKNFCLLPCENIQQICITRVLLSGDDVQRIYSHMLKLNRGYLDHIGDDGMAMAALVSHEVEMDRLEDEQTFSWWTDEPGGFYTWMFHGMALVVGIAGMTVYANTIETFSARLVEGQDQRNQS